eukprot:9196078-Alexandrium_andersonii.AAC.1
MTRSRSSGRSKPHETPPGHGRKKSPGRERTEARPPLKHSRDPGWGKDLRRRRTYLAGSRSGREQGTDK